MPNLHKLAGTPAQLNSSCFADQILVFLLDEKNLGVLLNSSRLGFHVDL